MPDPTLGSDAIFFLTIGLTACVWGFAGLITGWK